MRDSGPGEYGNQWYINKIFLPSGIGQEGGHDQCLVSIDDIAVDTDLHPEICADLLRLFDKSSRRLNRNDDLTGQDGRPQALGFHAEQALVPEVAGYVAGRFFNIAVSGS